MDGNNWRTAQGQAQIPGLVIGGEADMEGSDWRIHVEADSRQRIVSAIMETLKRFLPFSGQEGLQEIQRIAVSFEEKIYTRATSQLYPLLSDYLRMICLTMEPESQNPMANSLQSSATSNSHNPQDPDSLSQTGNVSGGDWQEETYQKIKSMNERYFPELNEMCKRMAAKLQQHDALPQQPTNEQLEKLKFLKSLLERLIQFLQTNKNEVQLHHKDKIDRIENQIVIILNSNRPRKPVSSLQQQSDAAGNSINPQYPASQSMQSQMQNQVQQLPIQMGSHQYQMHTYGFGGESPDVIIAHLGQELSLKNSEIEELKSKNASLENLVSHLQARVQQDEQKYHEMTRMMSQLNMLS